MIGGKIITLEFLVVLFRRESLYATSLLPYIYLFLLSYILEKQAKTVSHIDEQLIIYSKCQVSVCTNRLCNSSKSNIVRNQ